MARETAVETTLEDLIVALMEEAAPYVRDEKEAYEVFAFAVTHLLNSSSATSRKWQYWN